MINGVGGTSLIFRWNFGLTLPLLFRFKLSLLVVGADNIPLVPTISRIAFLFGLYLITPAEAMPLSTATFRGSSFDGMEIISFLNWVRIGDKVFEALAPVCL